MPKLTIVCAGKMKETYQKDAINEYLKRLSKYFTCSIEEVPDIKIKDDASLKEEELVIKKEGELLLKKIPSDSYVFALDLHGKQFDSVAFASKIDSVFISGYSHICFVIGGSLGISSDVLARANEKISLSKMTFTHLMTREIILEQVYRACKINHKEKYHK